MKTLQGIPAARGIAIAPVFRYLVDSLEYERIEVADTRAEMARLERALATATEQLQAVYERALAEAGINQAAIFQAQMEMLADPELVDALRHGVLNDALNAEVAVEESTENYARLLDAMGDEYFKARAADIRDVAKRVLRLLLGRSQTPTENLRTPSIVFADDLTPSDTVLLDKRHVLGFCTSQGGATAHTAILARSLGLPAVVGVGPEIMSVPEGEVVIVDGGAGQVLLDPDEATCELYRRRRDSAGQVAQAARQAAHDPAITLDGHAVEVVANIGNVKGAEDAENMGAEGIGLLRTEFLYLESTSLPDEEDQFCAYREILQVFGDRPVVLRTLDIGGDKEVPYLGLKQEINPFLGVRAIRLCLNRMDLFKPQLRAALRAGVGHNLKIMFPMVATLGEVRAARKILDECCRDLVAEGRVLPERVEVGIMVEIPSAAVMADQLAREVDFFSIGTNDLTQYTMAADRTNGLLDYLANAFHPAVLRLIGSVISAAHRQGKWVGLCGELAGEPLALPILLGLGLDEFSMNPPAIPLAKKILRSLSQAETQVFAQGVLDLEDGEAVQAAVRAAYPVVSLE